MKFPKISKYDIITFVLASLLLGMAFSVYFEGPFDLSHWFAAFGANTILVAISLASRLYIQKIRAHKYKANIEFKLFLPGGAMALLTSLATFGRVIYTQVNTLTITPKSIKPSSRAIIALYGIITSFMLVLFSKLTLNQYTFSNELMIINSYLILFNIIPASTILNKFKRKKLLPTEGDKMYLNHINLWKITIVGSLLNLFVLWTIPNVLTSMSLVFLTSLAAYWLYHAKYR